ncbi:hypothetical protein ACRB68_61580 [Actinomadura sp. RB68]|uniref:Uncharacterized protein n=1 Tax=Actinomadura macrotermitis TaxID=2585200 RepID=A0A7K0C4L0_9ACTN|nr:hypothetical protein [Actinomadura macrotermitis]
MKPKLNAGNVAERPVEHKGIADLGGERVADSFIVATLADTRAVRIAEEDTDGDSLPGLVLKNAQKPGILG